MNNDWRINGQIDYLFRAKLTHKTFHSYGNCDHAHCEFCWEKLGEAPDTRHAGYCAFALGQHCWICDDCFRDFHEQFEWTVIEMEKEAKYRRTKAVLRRTRV